VAGGDTAPLLQPARARQLHDVLHPVVTDSGTKIPGLTLGQARSHARQLEALGDKVTLAAAA
jgi:hypothetical protein